MKLIQSLSLFFILPLALFICGCNTNEDAIIDEKESTNNFHETEITEQPANLNIESEFEPITCIDWIGFYGKSTRELDSVVKMFGIEIKSEGFDQYNSTNKLEGVYVLTDKNLPVENIGQLAKYLAYKLCLSDSKKFSGVLMDCNKRKVQVVIARSEEKFVNESWAVVFNVYPANKKGDLHILDYK
jgi:hypothetical protein